ncbi:MAG: Protein QmcA [Elusimicrobia bacterium]|nr:Protein QmcA [Elusimicrobiota bacterium]
MGFVSGLIGSVLFPFLVLGFIIVYNGARVLAEYERGVVFRLGRLIDVKGPGLIIIIPFVDRMVRVDLRTITLDVPVQEVITRDNVTVKVNAVCYFRVLDPNKAVVAVQNYIVATSQIAQTSMRSVVGQVALDELLSNREELNARLQKIIDHQTDPWGIKVSIVELKDVQIPENMQRAMAQQAEAERERRAKIINAEGELQASQKLAEAAGVLGKEPGALQLRYLQTAREMTSGKSSTIIFPLPIDLMNAFAKLVNKS